MKRILLAVIVLGSAMAMQSCNNGDYKATPNGNLPKPTGGGGNGGGGNGITGGIMIAKVDGNNFVATNGSALANGPLYAILGQNASGAIMLGFMSGSPAPGEYTVDGTTVIATYTEAANPSNPFAGNSGKITITTNDAVKVVGTFNFSNGTKNCTDGTFSINK